MPDPSQIAVQTLREELARYQGPIPTIEAAKRGGLTCTVNQRQVHGRYDPVKDSQRQLAAVSQPPGPLHIHFGFGLGYLAAADPPAAGGVTLVFEPNPGLVLAALGHPKLQHHFHAPTQVCCDPQRFKQLLRRHMVHNVPVRVVISRFHRETYPDHLQQFMAWLKNERNTRALENATHQLGSLRFHESTLRSLPWSHQCRSVTDAAQYCRNQPAVIVAPGPSLDGNLPDLIPYQNKVLIFALSRTAAILDRVNIKPHFLVHNESQELDHHISRCTNLSHTCFMLADQAHAGFYRHNHGATLVYQNPVNRVSRLLGQWLPPLNRPQIPSGGSVANDAFALAVLLGCNPVVLIGQDLAQSHARYYAQAETNQAFTHRENEVTTTPGYFGGKVSTTINYKAFLSWYEEAVAAYAVQDPKRIFINATEGGAAIQGFQQHSLRDTAQRYFTLSTQPFKPPQYNPPLSRTALQRFLTETMLAQQRIQAKIDAEGSNPKILTALRDSTPLLDAFCEPEATKPSSPAPGLKVANNRLTAILRDISQDL